MDEDLMAEAQPAFCLQRQTANKQAHKHKKFSTLNSVSQDEPWAGEPAQVHAKQNVVDEQLSHGK